MQTGAGGRCTPTVSDCRTCYCDQTVSRDVKQQSRESFDKQAKDYDVAPYGRHARWLQPDVLAALTALQPPPGALLDVGCGTGALLEAIAHLLPDAELFGIDLSPAMLDVAGNRLAARAHLVVADAEQLPLGDASVDLTVCVDSFHHYPQPKVALAEMHRVTRPDGTLVIGEWRVPSPLRQLMNALFPHVPSGDVRIYVRRELEGLLAEVGFSDVRWQKAGRRGQLVVCQR